MQALEIAAFALPVADLIIDELELAYATEIGNRKHRSEYRLQTDIFTFIRQKVHLQELLVRIFLDFDQIRDRNRSFYFRKINSIGSEAVVSRHRISKTPLQQAGTSRDALPGNQKRWPARRTVAESRASQ